jgi:hypothetical protein
MAEDGQDRETHHERGHVEQDIGDHDQGLGEHQQREKVDPELDPRRRRKITNRFYRSAA